MKNAFVALLATASMAFGAALYADPSNAARVDVNGITEAVALAPGKAEGGSIAPFSWVPKEKQDSTLSGSFPASADWKKANFSFTPGKDGVITLYFMGQWAKDPKERAWVIFDAVELDGATLKNGDFENGFADWWQGGEKRSLVVDAAKSGLKAAKVNHDNGAGQNVNVKGGQPVTVSFWYKLAE